MNDNLVRLNQNEYLAEGMTRYVYVHPENPDLLIKILKCTIKKWVNNEELSVRNYHRFFKYLLRELAEYARLKLHFAPNSPSNYIQQIIGFADTNLGLGLVVQAEKNEQGNYAKTLFDVITDGQFNEQAEQHLEEFLAHMTDIDICVIELTANNVVYAFKPSKGYHFVLVDGFGEKTLLSFAQYSFSLRKIKRIKTIKSLRRQVSYLLKVREDNAQEPCQ
jgi:hypothetical protein